MEYILVKDNIVTELISTSERRGEPWVQVDLDGGIYKGADVRMYDAQWRLRPLSDLVEEGLVELEKAGPNHTYKEGTVLQKVVGEELHYKTDEELAVEGARELLRSERIEDGKLVVLDIYQMVSEGIEPLADGFYLDHEKKRVWFFAEIEPSYEAGLVGEEAYLQFKKDDVMNQLKRLELEINGFAMNPLKWMDLEPEQQQELGALRKQVIALQKSEDLLSVVIPELPEFARQ